MIGSRTRANRWLVGLLAIGSLVGCDTTGPPEIAAGMDGCAACGMVIPEANQACAFTVDREDYLFCSTGCLLDEYEARRKTGKPAPDALYFADFQTGEQIGGSSTVFLLTDRVPTVMDWGILAFGDRNRALSMQEGDEPVVDWLGLRTVRGDVDRTLEVSVTPVNLEPDIVELEKGELVEWIVRGRDLDADLTVALRGYEELGEISLPASGEPVSRRMLAIRPGDGFPFVRADTGEVLGQVRVRGAHTADEAAQ